MGLISTSLNMNDCEHGSKVHLANEMYDLAQDRYCVVMCLMRSLPIGAIRGICSFMGHRFLHMYNLENNDTTTNGIHGFSRPVVLDGQYLFIHPVVFNEALHLSKVNINTFDVEVLTLPCGNDEEFQVEDRVVVQIYFLNETHLCLLTQGLEQKSQIRVYDMTKAGDPPVAHKLIDDLSCVPRQISASSIFLPNAPMDTIVEVNEKGEVDLVDFALPQGEMEFVLSFRDKLLFILWGNTGTQLYWQGVRERIPPQRWRDRLTTLDVQRKPYEFCSLEEFVMAVRDDGKLVPLVMPEGDDRTSRNRSFKVIDGTLKYQRYSDTGVADEAYYESYIDPELLSLGFFDVESVMDDNMSEIKWQTSHVKVQEGVMVIMSSRNCLCMVIPVQLAVEILRSVMEKSKTGKQAKEIHFPNAFIATYHFCGNNIAIIRNHTAPHHPLCLTINAKGFHAQAGTLDYGICCDSERSTCIEFLLGWKIGYSRNKCMESLVEAEGKLFISLSSGGGIVEVYGLYS